MVWKLRFHASDGDTVGKSHFPRITLRNNAQLRLNTYIMYIRMYININTCIFATNRQLSNRGEEVWSHIFSRRNFENTRNVSRPGNLCIHIILSTHVIEILYNIYNVWTFILIYIHTDKNNNFSKFLTYIFDKTNKRTSPYRLYNTRIVNKTQLFRFFFRIKRRSIDIVWIKLRIQNWAQRSNWNSRFSSSHFTHSTVNGSILQFSIQKVPYNLKILPGSRKPKHIGLSNWKQTGISSHKVHLWPNLHPFFLHSVFALSLRSIGRTAVQISRSLQKKLKQRWTLEGFLRVETVRRRVRN